MSGASTLSFGFGGPGSRIDVVAPDEELAEAAASLYPAYLLLDAEAATPRPPAARFLLRREHDGYALVATAGAADAAPAGPPSGPSSGPPARPPSGPPTDARTGPPRDAPAGPPTDTRRRPPADPRTEAPARVLPPERPATASATCGDLPDLLALLEGAMARAFIRLRPGLVPLHAAGVETPAGAVLAVGPGGAGKSSVALAWSAASRPLLGDDVVFLRPDGRAEAFRRLVKVDVARLAPLGLDPGSTPHRSSSSPDVWFDPARAGGWSVAATRPAVVAFLERGSDAPPAALPLDRAEALRRLLDAAMESETSPEDVVDALRALLDSARAVRLSFGSSPHAAAFLLDLAGGGDTPEPR